LIAGISVAIPANIPQTMFAGDATLLSFHSNASAAGRHLKFLKRGQNAGATRRYGMEVRQRAETLVDQAQRVMRESIKLVERREAHAKQMEHFVEQRGTIVHEMLTDTSLRVTPL